jgi:hypothetical protein
MTKALALLGIFAVLTGVALFAPASASAQEAGGEASGGAVVDGGAAEEIEEDEELEPAPADEYEGAAPTRYVSGEQNFVLTLGTVIPLFFTKGSDRVKTQVKPGGALFLGYNYFFTPRFFVGGEAGGMFAGTTAGNMLYVIPFGARAGYQFSAGRFEFPISFMVGGATQKYLQYDYFGLILKPAISALFRATPEWSFGINTAWWILPQWAKNSSKNMTGHFLEVTLSGRYHF